MCLLFMHCRPGSVLYNIFCLCILQMKRSDQREMTKTEDGHVLHAGEVAAGTEIEDVHVTGIQERKNPEGS